MVHLINMYENLADENVSAPNNPPVAQFSGEDAAKIMQTLISLSLIHI